MSNMIAIGIDLGGTNIKSGAVDQSGTIMHKDERPTNAESGATGVMDTLTRIVESYREYAPRAIGFGIPGPVRSHDGVVMECTNIPGWREVPLQEAMEEQTGLPVAVDNDGNTMALGECLYGAGHGRKNVMGITLGTGVGGGLIIDGEPFEPDGPSAVEIGHMIIVPDGPACPCGKRGCLESLVGNRRIVEHALRVHEQSGRDTWPNGHPPQNPAEICAAAQQGDPIAVQTWRDIARWLAIALVNITHLVCPEVFVIGGGVAKAGDVLFEPLHEEFRQRAWQLYAQRTEIVPARLGTSAGIVGAAALGMSVVRQ